MSAKDNGRLILKTKENEISVFSPRQLSTDFDIYEWICVKKNSLTKLQPWSQENVHHWEDEVGEEVVVDLGEFAPQAGRIPESGLKVVSYALGDHRDLFQKVNDRHKKKYLWFHNYQRQGHEWYNIILTRKKRSKTARAINRLLKLLLKLRLRSTFLSLTLVADFEQEDRTVPEEAHPDDFARSARTSYITFDPVHLSRANNPDNLYSLINHHRTMSDHSYDNYWYIDEKRTMSSIQVTTGQDTPASSLAGLILELAFLFYLYPSLYATTYI